MLCLLLIDLSLKGLTFSQDLLGFIALVGYTGFQRLLILQILGTQSFDFALIVLD